YKLVISNGDYGDITIDNISPNYSDTTIEREKYDTRYETSGDDSYISVTLKGTTLWSAADNNGEVAEGKRRYSVYAYDNVGNSLAKNRDFFVDFSKPTFESLTFNSKSIEDGKTYTTTDTTPSFNAKLTDNLTGDLKASSASENQIASGPRDIEVRIEKENLLGFDLLAVYRTNFAKTFWSAGDGEITDNNNNSSDKYGLFAYDVVDELDTGTYRVSVVGYDNTGNHTQQIIYLKVVGVGEQEEFAAEIGDKTTEAEEEDRDQEFTEEQRKDFQKIVEDDEYKP
ncbi:unnamed protein product, partial [marine sediment metagenome]